MSTRISIVIAATLVVAAIVAFVSAVRPGSLGFGGGPAAAAAPTELPAVLKPVVEKIQGKVAGGGTTEADFADELAEIDRLLAARAGQKTEEVGQIHLLRIGLYLQVLDNPEKALEIAQRVRTELPDTTVGRAAGEMIAALEPEVAAYRIRKSLVQGAAFPDFQETDMDGRPLSIAQFRGKVVLVDFWATWCGPCIAELPNVVAAYRKYRDRGFEIVGISLDEPGQEKALAEFRRKHDMPWPQYYDGAKWKSKLAAKYGISAIPATFLLDREGRIIARELRGADLDRAIAAALAP